MPDRDRDPLDLVDLFYFCLIITLLWSL